MELVTKLSSGIFILLFIAYLSIYSYMYIYNIIYFFYGFGGKLYCRVQKGNIIINTSENKCKLLDEERRKCTNSQQKKNSYEQQQ